MYAHRRPLLTLMLVLTGCGGASAPAELPGPPPFTGPSVSSMADTAVVASEHPAIEDTTLVAVEDSAAPAKPWATYLVDSIRSDRFDGGRMWRLQDRFGAYASRAYDVEIDGDWLETARRGALRLPGCSAGIVSPQGLVLTNHHCVRPYLSAVDRPGESIFEDGFAASTLAAERGLPGLYADQLIDVIDVTARLDGPWDPSQLERLRAEIVEEVGPTEHVEIIPRYGGARVAAFVYRRFDDVRLAFVPELAVARFGGDADGFAYPRYTLDAALIRVYENDVPVVTDVWFPVTDDRVEEGDAVFVVGSPAASSRHQSAAELAFRRDVTEPATLRLVEARWRVLGALVEAESGAGAPRDHAARASLANALATVRGQLHGLRETDVIARRADADRALAEWIALDPEREQEFGGRLEELGQLQVEKVDLAPGLEAFLGLTDDELSSATLRRSLYGFQLLNARQSGAGAEVVAELTQQIEEVQDQSPALDSAFVAERIRAFARLYGPDSRLVTGILRGETIEARAGMVVRSSLMARASSALASIEHLTIADPGIAFVRGYIPTYVAFLRAATPLLERESELSTVVARARFALRGRDVAPDADGTLRVSDGRIRGLDDVEATAPAFTTLFGLYDRHYAYFGRTEWALPGRWIEARGSLDLATPLNVVVDTDVLAGSSGSPILDAELELIGVVFDRNRASLSGDYVFPGGAARAIGVDVRGLLEVLSVIYGAGHLVGEMTSAR